LESAGTVPGKSWIFRAILRLAHIIQNSALPPQRDTAIQKHRGQSPREINNSDGWQRGSVTTSPRAARLPTGRKTAGTVPLEFPEKSRRDAQRGAVAPRRTKKLMGTVPQKHLPR
jgi:hypothetical protein